MSYTSADGLILNIQIYFNKTLDEHIQDIHEKMSLHYKWKYYPLKIGSFGYDNLLYSCYIVFTSYKENDDKDKIADYIHKGWIKNYIFWRDNWPWLNYSIYKKPYTELGDERRNKCSVIEYIDLPEDEKEKDLFIAEHLYKILSK